VAWDDDDDGGPARDKVHFRLDLSGGSSVQRRIPILPVLLIAFGAAALLHNMVGHGVSVFPLAIGIYLIARSGGGDHYPLFVVGVVLTGSGAGNLLGDIIGGGAGEAFGTLGTALGFFWLAQADSRRRSGWAIIPAAILGLIGIGQLGFHASQAFGGSPGWIVPAAVVVAGGLLLGAHRMPGPLRIAALVFVVAAALSLVSHNNDGHRGVLRGTRVLPTVPSANVDLPDLTGKTLYVSSDNGSVTVTQGSQAQARIGTGRVSTDVSDNRVTLSSDRDNAPWQIVVPPGTRLNLHTDNGPINVDVPDAAALDLQTDNGSISVGIGGDPSIAASSSSGSVAASGFDGATSRHSFAYSGHDNRRVQLETDNGAIVIRHVEGASSTTGGLR
jgi:putative adhesin